MMSAMYVATVKNSSNGRVDISNAHIAAILGAADINDV
jgi:hypothetical protein